MDAHDGPKDLGFEQTLAWKKLELEFISRLAEARLTDAKTASVEEHVLNQRLTNFTKAKSIGQFEADVRRFQNKRAEKERELADLRRHLEALSHYKLGHRIADFSRQPCWSGYRVLLAKLPFSVIEQWAATPAPEPKSDDWVGRMISGTKCIAPVPQPHRNVAELLDWQLEKHASTLARFASPPHLASMQALSAVDTMAAGQVTFLTDAIKAIEGGFYDLWKPQDLVKLVDSPISN